MGGYETNLASEFYVLAVLYRLGADATMSLGNKKAVDITVVRSAGDVVTIDVKAVADKYDWPVGKLHAGIPDRHFFALLSFEGKFSDPLTAPNVWIVPFLKVNEFIKPYAGGMNVVSRALMKRHGAAYKDSWHLIIGDQRG